MAALLFGHSFPETTVWLRGNPRAASDQEIIGKLISRACAERFGARAAGIAPKIEQVLTVTLNAGNDPAGHVATGHAMLAPLDVLRVIGAKQRLK